MTRTVRKQNNESDWAQFVEDARSYMKEKTGSTERAIRLWYLSDYDCVLKKPSSGRVIGAFEVTRQSGHLEHVLSVTAITDESVTVETERY